MTCSHEQSVKQAGSMLSPSRVLLVRAPDGTGIHTEVFGRDESYPIVLVHGIACALQVWHQQINDLAQDYRVIAFDHRGHGRSEVPPRSNYSLDHLAGDLQAVLATTLGPDERALLVGHSMGGIAISYWAERCFDRVREHVDAIALINTTTGDLLKELRLLRVPPVLASGRVFAARHLVRLLGAIPLFPGAELITRRFAAQVALGTDVDSATADFVHSLFAATPAVSRGAWARVLVDSLGPRHIDLRNLAVPALIIGSSGDRLAPLGQARRIAASVPNLVELIELSGGHCAILEHPDTVSRCLRALAETTPRIEAKT
jgi:pimeloyl-ACP methyl ester carboxylesterase